MDILTKNLEENENDNNYLKYLFLNDLLVNIMKIINFMQNVFDQKIFYEKNNIINSTFYLNSHSKINKEKILNEDIQIKKEEINNLIENINEFFKIILNYEFNENIYLHSFNIFLNIINYSNITENKNKNKNNNEEKEYNDDTEYREESDDENFDDGNKNDDKDFLEILKENISINNTFLIELEKYIKNLLFVSIECNNLNDEKGFPIIYDLSLEIIKKKLNNIDENELDFSQIDILMNFLTFFGHLIKFFCISIDHSLMNKIINYIETYLSKSGDSNLVEKIFIGFMEILSAYLFVKKNKISDKNEYLEDRIHKIYERIKEIILEENIINKVRAKLDELKMKDVKMLSSKEIKEFFYYINNKTEGETLAEKTFLAYKDFIINYSDDSILAEIIKQLLENIENYKNQDKNKSKEEIRYFMCLTQNDDLFYANSIIQQLFNIPIFRDVVLSLDDEWINTKKNMINELQNMFAYMKYSENKVYNTHKFCGFFKSDISLKETKEGRTFLDIFFSQIGESLNNTKYKYLLDDTFRITISTTNMCLNCGDMEENFVSYYCLKVNIKGFGNLQKALKAKFNQTQVKAECKNCENSQEKTKKISIFKLPNILIIHLDRIYDNYEFGGKIQEKINDRLEFDFSLDLNSENLKICSEYDSISEFREISNTIYKRKPIYYKYDIQGIVTYHGNTEKGVYYSFIKKEDGNKWIQFSDENFSEIDEKTVKFLSYGNNQDDIPNAYFLIYKRRKEYPLRILNLNKIEEKKQYDNYYIKFQKELRERINKFYDVSRLYDENIDEIFGKNINEKELKKYIFHDLGKNEIYSKMTPEEIEMETQMSKSLFTKIIKDNNKFLKKNELDESKKCEFKFSLIILDAINSRDFLFFNHKDFNFEDIKKLIYFFNQQIFGNGLIEVKNFSLGFSPNFFLKKNINIFIEKLILPILSNEYKDEKIYELISLIGNIFLSKENIKKILNPEKNKRIFDEETVKKFLNIIYQLIKDLLNKEEYNKNINFKDIFKLFFDSVKKITDDSILFFENTKVQDNLLCLYENLLKIIKLKNDFFKLPINDLLIILDKIKYFTKREISKIIYQIILFLIKDNNSTLKGISNILNEQFLKIIFNENSELLSEIILRLDYNDTEEKSNFNKLIIPSLFNYALKNEQMIQLLDLLFKVINIKDKFTLERLYLIMGFPQMIIEKQDNESNESSVNFEEKYKNNYEEFWPKFGVSYMKSNNTEEIFKYVSNIKLYETHCILAQLFPCSDLSLYDNDEFIKNEQILTDNEKVEYIYKLLKLALLNKGNYCLFKYIYLTQSRFIIKYKNLYEEIIDILSNEKNNKYDLSEIKEKAEIYIKLLNYEFNKVLGNKNYLENEESVLQLQYKIKNEYNIYETIENFTGFIPKHIPNKISKAFYSINQEFGKYMIITLKYYTTYEDIKNLRIKKLQEQNQEDDDDDEKEINNNENQNIKIEDEIGDFLPIDIVEEEFQDKEYSFLTNIYERFKKNNNNTFGLQFDNSEDNKNIKLTLVRYILVNSSDKDLIFKEKPEKEINDQNYFIPQLPNIGYSYEENFGEIFNIYRRNCNYKFLNDIAFEAAVFEKNKISFPSETYFSD